MPRLVKAREALRSNLFRPRKRFTLFHVYRRGDEPGLFDEESRSSPERILNSGNPIHSRRQPECRRG